jgi:hypothetical protein
MQIMASRKSEKLGFDSPLGGRKRSRADAQFDSWLVDRLHRVYDPVLQEPLPEDLLRLVESFDNGNDKSEPAAPTTGEDEDDDGGR